MTFQRILAPVGVSLFLSACGGGGGNVETVGPPPPVHNTQGYITATNLPDASHLLNAPALRFERTSSSTERDPGNHPLSISFDKDARTYTLRAPDDSSRVFNLSERATTTGENFESYVQTPNNHLYRLTLERTAAIPLTYVMFGGWDEGSNLTGDFTSYAFVTGSPTKQGDLPTGTATYAMTTTGTIARNDGESAGPIEALSTVTLSVDFQAGQLSTSLNLVARPAFAIDNVNYGTYTGTASISTASSTYAGQLQGDRGSGEFVGGFFGPKAYESGYVWAITGDTFQAVGNAAGRRNEP